VEKQRVFHNPSVCICSLRYPVCNAHSPYCQLWLAPLCNISQHYLINGTISEKKILIIKCVFWFSLQLLTETFLILRRNERDTIRGVYWSSRKVLFVFLSDFNETWIFWADFRKILKYQIWWKPVQRKPSCSMWADGRTDMTKLIVAFRNFANAPKTAILATLGTTHKTERTSVWNLTPERWG